MRNNGSLLPALVTLAATAACGSSGPESSPLRSLALHFEVFDNHYNGAESFKAALTLSNRGHAALAQDWELYFNFGRRILTPSLPDGIAVTHVNGDFFKMTPTGAFAPLEPGASFEIPFEARNWIIKEGEAPAGPYVVFMDDEGRAGPPKEVEITVAPFVTPRQTDRFAGDQVPRMTPAGRYRLDSQVSLLGVDEVLPIVPTPVGMTRGAGQVTLDASWEIRYAAGLDGEAEVLNAALESLLGTRLTAVEGTGAGDRTIALKLADVSVEGETRQDGDEAYRLSLGDGIEITGTDAAGVFYAVQSLRALVPPEAYRSRQDSVTLDQVVIRDFPRFPYRGIHLDVARNFHSKDTVKKLLDLAAFYKLNRFHFHLTDDEGWRLEIAALPELTEVGARRGHTTDESDRLLPSFGSGPDPEAFPGSGHYSRADFVEILRFAHQRHIEVIPEIDLPGHARAAIKAMQARHARLRAEGRDEEAAEYQLVDPQDRSEYMSVQMWNDNVIDVCLPSTYRFLETVVDEIRDMYAEAGAPLATLHTGGDEVPHGVWERSPACERRIAEADELSSVDDLAPYFLRRFASLLDERGLRTAGWEEIALTETQHDDARSVKTPNPAFLGRSFQPYVWNNVWGWGAEDVGYQLANAGYEIVMCNATNLYFDLTYEKDPEEPGYYWAAFVDTKKPFELVPFDLFKNAGQDLMGRPLDPKTFAGRARLSAAGRANVLGIQGQLWSENAKSPKILEYLAFPRLLALAERAWAAQPGWALIDDTARREAELAAAWNEFATRLGRRELPRLDYLYGGVAYRIPPPGAIVEDGELRANTAFPGLEIRYTTDGSEPTPSSTLYTEPVAAAGNVRLKAFDTRGRSSRTSVVR